MDFFNVLAMLGGLALFLYGMKALGDGLENLTGGKLQRVLEKLTSNPIKAVLLGAGVTAVIQSSSATTVMVVGFVNSGIMRLTQAIGIIMGANIGTTATSWILSLAGIESDLFWVKMLKPSSFSPILALVGIVFLLFSKSEKKKILGEIFLGFAILMFGMEAMSDAVKPLREVPEFTSILTMFSNPLFGVLAGAILTAIIQSSSASVGILQALCMTGAVSFGTALPIIMGQNIGTCITAILSSIGANKNAKRAALVHLYFNLIGTTIFLVVFYAINAVVDFSFLAEAADPKGIAIIHSSFNIGATILLLPFSKVLEKLAFLTIPESDAEKQEIMDFKLLDARFLEQPSFAVEQSLSVTMNMAHIVKDSMLRAIAMLNNYNETEAAQLYALENKVDKYEDELGTYLVKLSSRNLTEQDSKMLSILLHSIGDFERISDHSVNIVETAKEMYDKKITFSESAVKELEVYIQAVKDILETAVQVFETQDLKLAATIEPIEEVIDEINAELKFRHIMRLRAEECTIELGFIFSDILTNFERVADHCSNIGVSIIQLQEDHFDTHEYLDNVKKGTNEEFMRMFSEYKGKYQLPNNQ